MDVLELIQPFARMLDGTASPAAIRGIEHDGGGAMWSEIAASGFLDALVDENVGGAGLPLSVVGALWQELGRRAVPLPVGETMIARALLAAEAVPAPDGPIALAVAAPGQRVVVLSGLIARHVLVEIGGALYLVEAASGDPEPTGVAGDLSAAMRWNAVPTTGGLAVPTGGLWPLIAVLRASLIAGAADRLVEMTASYANERVQFGKPIGRQQALQQNMAVMAGEAVAARISSQLGSAAGFPPSLAAAAIAKSVAGKAAVRVAATAHAVHGAIGISEEHDLQLFTRRLHEWRLADGSEGYWNRQLGALRLASDAGSVDYVRDATSGSQPAP